MKCKKIEIELNSLSIVLFLAAAATMVLSGIKVSQVNDCIKEQTEIENNRWECEIESQKLADASDYFTCRR